MGTLADLLHELEQSRFHNAPCQRRTDQFFGPNDVDARTDGQRAAREAHCKALCSACPYRLPCLEMAMVWERAHSVKDIYGVWGGMGEGERKQFHAHLKAEGYNGEVPHGLEFLASVRAFYQNQTARKLARSAQHAVGAGH
jgi:hypothetical protein